METNSSISNFKRFTLRILAPLLLSVAAFGLVFEYFFERKVVLDCEIIGNFKVHRILTNDDPQEIPILGSSRAESSFMPSVINPRCFNYGLSGVQDNVILFFLNEECKKTRKTPIIINFDLDGLSYSLGDPSSFITNAGYAPVRALLGDDYRHAYRIPFVKYYGYYDTYAALYLNSKTSFTRKADRGALLDLQQSTAERFKDVVNARLATKEAFHNDPVLEHCLTQIIKTHPDRHMYFVVTPSHASYYKTHTGLPQVKAFLRLLDTFPNVDLIDMGEVDYPDSLYKNTTHLRYNGALKFSEAFRDTLLAKEALRIKD